MHIHIGAWVLIFALANSVSEAQATAMTKKGGLEKYSAVEDPGFNDLELKTTQVPAAVLPSKSVQTEFTQIPPQKKGTYLKRLELAEELIRKHGLAYDYISSSAEELRTVLQQLDQPVTSQVAAKPPLDFEPQVTEE